MYRCIKVIWYSRNSSCNWVFFYEFLLIIFHVWCHISFLLSFGGIWPCLTHSTFLSCFLFSFPFLFSCVARIIHTARSCISSTRVLRNSLTRHIPPTSLGQRSMLAGWTAISFCVFLVWVAEFNDVVWVPVFLVLIFVLL